MTERRDEERIDALCRALRDADADVRREAAETLLELHGITLDDCTRCGDLLVGIGSDDSDMCGLARDALTTLVERLQDRDEARSA